VNRQKGRLNEPPFFVSTLAHYRSRESGGWLSRHVAMVAGARGNRCVAYRTHNQAAGGRAVALPGDVQNESYANQLVGLATRQFGGLDIAFNNAATMGELGSIVDMSRENWTRTLETNLTSAFLGAKYQIPAMLARGGGSLIFTSTFVGHTVGFPGTVAYAASKSGLIGITQVLAAEFGSAGIRVNALLPGGTDTEMAREMNNTEEAQAFVRSLHALKRLAKSEEIARSALYLASDASSFTTGTALLADGGVSITRT
jgi:NAD(P)-dependent dehydrogenase (short-subunit alcohol dehydrogenase family)